MTARHHTPKFRRNAGRYPLTRFQRFLAGRFRAPTVTAYTSAIRRMLATLGEGVDGAQGMWKNEAAVNAYVADLNRGLYDRTKQALTHWLAFNLSLETGRDTPLPPKSRAADTTIVGVIRILNAWQGHGFPRFTLDELPTFRWARTDEGEYAFRLPNQKLYRIARLLLPLCLIIRQWSGAKDGDLFIPGELGTDKPMDAATIRRLVTRAVPQTVMDTLDGILEETRKKAFENFTPARSPETRH